jgi:outer membrane immunogenic protein
MKKLLLISAAFAALITAPATAADQAVRRVHRRPVVVAAPVYSWAGWYAGVNAGASFGNVKTDFNVAPATFLQTPTCCVGLFNSFTTPGFADSDREYPDGFIGGGQIGYNYQLSPIWVVGFEADFQGALEKDHSTITSNFNVIGSGIGQGGPFTFPVSGSTSLAYQTKRDWFGTVRGRIGYVWGNGAVLTYVTGGLAYGKVDIEGTSTPISGTGRDLSVTQAFGHSQVNAGWVAGFGMEGKLLIPGWTYKIESLYMDLGTLDAGTPGVSATLEHIVVIENLNAGPITTHSHFTDAILRVGLNYKFGNYYAPVVSK